MGEISGDFERLVAPLVSGLRAHCYRMLGSVHDADDAVQETLLRAWRGMERFEGRSTLRTWLYTIATRVCIDATAARGRRALPIDLTPASERVEDSMPAAETAWLGPFPDDPADVYGRRNAVELAFVAALQHLPGNQRAALLLFDVLGFPVAEIATMMRTSTTSVNSALARARRLLAARLGDDPPEHDDEAAIALARRFAAALQDGDLDGFVALLTDDVTWAMPPLPHWYQGRRAVTEFAAAVPMSPRCPSWQYRLVRANARPAVAFWLGPEPGAPHEPWSLTVLDTRDGRISGLTSFLDATVLDAFGL
nr:RNA polymerase subunit sigma-70 [Jiangella endophytica]